MPREMTPEERAEKFHKNEVPLRTCGIVLLIGWQGQSEEPP